MAPLGAAMVAAARAASGTATGAAADESGREAGALGDHRGHFLMVLSHGFSNIY